MQCLFSPTSKAQSFKKIFLKKKKKLHALYLRKSQVILQQSTKCVLNREKDGPNPTSTSSNIQNNPSHKRQMHHQASILPNLKIWSKIKHIIELLTRVSKWKGESKPAQIKNTNPPPPPPKKGGGDPNPSPQIHMADKNDENGSPAVLHLKPPEPPSTFCLPLPKAEKHTLESSSSPISATTKMLAIWFHKSGQKIITNSILYHKTIQLNQPLTPSLSSSVDIIHHSVSDMRTNLKIGTWGYFKHYLIKCPKSIFHH